MTKLLEQAVARMKKLPASEQDAIAQIVLDEVDSGLDYGAPDHLTIRNDADLKAKLRQGAQSPARELSPDDWEQKRRHLAGRRDHKR